MRRRILYGVIILFFVNVFVFSVHCFANSSWHWLTNSPKKILPFAVVITLFIEIFSVVKFAGVKDIRKACVVITLTNLLSFLAPYIERANRFKSVIGSFSIDAAFSKGPYYIVLIGFLVLTVLVELPVGFLFLKKNASSSVRLMLSILISNIITTGGVAIAERIICVGQW